MDELARCNAARTRAVEGLRDDLVAAHQGRKLPRFGDYPLPRLREQLANSLSARWGQGRLEPQLDMIDRSRFEGDIALKFPQLLSDGGPKGFIVRHLPWIVETLQGEAFRDVIAAVRTKGMYVNLTLSDAWLIRSAQTVADLGVEFGTSDVQRDRTILIDYSSPNIAKVLHAGHVRSTIIGHVLSKLHEACGALGYRVNHINDFGGFGFMLEGFRRFDQQFPPELRENDRLLEIYRIRRTLERLVAENAPFSELEDEARDLLARYFPDVRNSELCPGSRDSGRSRRPHAAALHEGGRTIAGQRASRLSHRVPRQDLVSERPAHRVPRQDLVSERPGKLFACLVCSFGGID